MQLYLHALHHEVFPFLIGRLRTCQARSDSYLLPGFPFLIGRLRTERKERAEMEED